VKSDLIASREVVCLQTVILYGKTIGVETGKKIEGGGFSSLY